MSRLPFPFDIDPAAAMGRDGLYVTLGENQGPQIRQLRPGGPQPHHPSR